MREVLEHTAGEAAVEEGDHSSGGDIVDPGFELVVADVFVSIVPVVFVGEIVGHDGFVTLVGFIAVVIGDVCAVAAVIEEDEIVLAGFIFHPRKGFFEVGAAGVFDDADIFVGDVVGGFGGLREAVGILVGQTQVANVGTESDNEHVGVVVVGLGDTAGANFG